MKPQIAILFFLIFIKSNAQINFFKHEIVNNINGYSKIITADLDNDGDEDAIIISYSDKLYRFMNIDGLGNFSLTQTIDYSLGSEPFDIISADIDNDGDIDVITSFISQNILVWHENQDGLGNFSEGIIIDNNADEILSIGCQ